MTSKTTRNADDKPFDFNLDAFEAEVNLSPFRFHWSGRRWTMTHVEALNAWGLIAASGEKETEVIVQVFEQAMGGEQYAEFSKVPLPQYKLKALFDAYTKFCNVVPGESQGSTD